MPRRKKIRALLTVCLALSLSTPTLAQERKVINITATEFTFKPSKISVPSGEVRIIVTNRGESPHGLAIVSRKEKISYIDSGETKSLMIRFDNEEELVFYCPQPGHRGKGMEGKINVEKEI